MKVMTNTTNITTNNDVFMDEYTRNDIIGRYLSRTAGAGIEYVLRHVYEPVYVKVIKKLRDIRPRDHQFRIMEYGCGGGMNLLKVMEVLGAEGIRIEKAYGADFSAPMIEAARREAQEHLPKELMSKIVFAVAGNEDLANGLSRSLSVPDSALTNSFDLIVGVNTTRYAHRLEKQTECARDIFNLLRPGGYTVMIDMNRYFPFFRSNLRNLFKPKREVLIPTLRQYTQPFESAGFRIEEKRNFCWAPHSANRLLLGICRTLSPVLDTFFSPFAMRSLIIAQKPR